MSDLKRSVVSGLRWQAAAKLGSQLISWTVTIVVMRLLAPADYGLMAMAMVLVGLTSLVAEMGLGASLVRSPSVDVAQQRHVFGLCLLINSGLYLVLALAAPLAVWVFKEPRLLALTLVMGVQLPLAALAVVPESMARRELKFKALSVVELVVQVGTVLTTLGLATAGAGVWALVGGQLAQAVLKATLMLGHFGTVRPSFGLRGQQALLGFGGSLTLNRIVWFVYSQADLFIAGRMLGSQALGAYSAAVGLANMPMQKIMAISNQVAFSAFSKLQGDPQALAAGVLRSIRLVAALAVGLLWGMAAAAPVLIPLLLGEKWSPAVLPLQLVALAVPLRIVSSMLSTAAIAAGFVTLDLRNNVTALLILSPAFLAGAHLGGINGLAAAWLLAFPVFFVVVTRRSAHVLHLRTRQVLAQLGMPSLAGTAMAAAIHAVMFWGHDLPAAVRLGLMVIAGAGVFVLTLALLDRSTLQELIGFVRPSGSSRPEARTTKG